MARYALDLSADEHERYRRQAEASAEGERELWEAAGVRPGAAVLDVGCGPGATLELVAALVGEHGVLVGVDQDPDAVAAAREKLARSVVRDTAVVHAEVPDEIPELASDRFDVVFLRHVLGHNGGREVELVRWARDRARPGGTVFVLDTDLTMMRIVPPTAPVSELYQRYDAFRSEIGDDPRIGTRLGDLVVEAGLDLAHYSGTCAVMRRRAGARGPAWAARRAMVERGSATADEVERWAAEFEALDTAEVQPRYFLVGFAALGVKPADP